MIVGAALNLSYGRAAPLPAPKPTIQPDIKNLVARKYVSDGLKAYRSGDKKLGIKFLRRAEAAAPEDEAVQFLLGRSLLLSRQPASAESYFRRARGKSLPDEMILPSLFDAMIMQHEGTKLLNEFPAPPGDAHGKIAAEILRGRAMALLSLDSAMHSIDHVDQAAASMDRSLTLARGSRSLLERAQIARLQNHSSLASKMIDEALKKDSENGRVMLAKLDDLMLSNNDKAALALSERILKLFPGDLTTRGARIEIFLNRSQNATAKAELADLMAKAPDAPMARYYQAVVLFRNNKRREAWNLVLTLPPIFGLAIPRYVVQLSQMAIETGHIKTADTILAKGLDISPDQLDLRLRLAEIRMQQEGPLAVLLLLKPIKESKDLRVLDLLGQAKLGIGDVKGAIETLRQANQIQPLNGRIAFHLAQALNEGGERNAARELLGKLLTGGYRFAELEDARRLAERLR